MNDPGCAAQMLVTGASSYAGDRHPYRELASSYTRQGRLVLGLAGHASGAALRGDAGSDLSGAATAAAAALVDRSRGEPVAVLAPLHELLLEFTARLLFGVDVTPHAVGFVSAIRLLEECWANEFAPDPSMQPLHQDYLRAISAQNETVDVIRHTAGIDAPRVVVLRTLLNGYHATATALTWALWELARHPDVQESVRAEVDTPDGDLARFTLTRRVVFETLRLHPPAWNIGRRASRRHELGGTAISEGAYVSVSPYVMHRSERLWPRPDAFLPDRFVAGAARRRRCSYLPFGAGDHRCPAARTAVDELQILLAAFVQRARFEPAEVTVRPRGLIGLRPEPDVYLRFAGIEQTPRERTGS